MIQTNRVKAFDQDAPKKNHMTKYAIAPATNAAMNATSRRTLRLVLVVRIRSSCTISMVIAATANDTALVSTRTATEDAVYDTVSFVPLRPLKTGGRHALTLDTVCLRSPGLFMVWCGVWISWFLAHTHNIRSMGTDWMNGYAIIIIDTTAPALEHTVTSGMMNK